MALIDVNHILPKEGYGQFTSTTCWYASYRLLHAWKQADESQIRSNLEAGGLNWKELTTRGIYPEEWPVAGSRLGLCGWEGRLVKAWDDEMIVYALKGYGPLYFTWDYGSSGHAVVIGGFDKKLNQFKVWNPYNRFEPGTVEIDWFTPDAFRERLHAGRWALQAWWR